MRDRSGLEICPKCFKPTERKMLKSEVKSLVGSYIEVFTTKDGVKQFTENPRRIYWECLECKNTWMEEIDGGVFDYSK